MNLRVKPRTPVLVAVALAWLALPDRSEAGLTLTYFGAEVAYSLNYLAGSTQSVGASFSDGGVLLSPDPRFPMLNGGVSGVPRQFVDSAPNSNSLYAPSVTSDVPSANAVPTKFGSAATALYTYGVGQQGVLSAQGGLYFDVGSYLADNLGPNDSGLAAVSFTGATAVFRNDTGGSVTIRPAEVLSVRGTLGASSGSYVAAALETRITLPGQESSISLAPVVLAAGQFGGNSTSTVQSTGPNPLNSASLSFSGNRLFATASSFDDSTVTLLAGQSITIQALLTLISDPGSSIQITDALSPDYNSPPIDFGAFAGGPDGAAVPEPSAIVLLGVGLGLASAAAWRRSRA